MTKKNDHDYLIAESPWLTSIDPAFARTVLCAVHTIKVQRGQLIYERGDPPGGLYGIQDGLVSAGLDDTISSVISGHIFKPGDWFGEIPTLTDGPRLVNTVAIRDCTLLTVPVQKMREICETQPQGWRWLAILVVVNNGVAIQIARDLLLTDLRQRITSVIKRLIGQSPLPFHLGVTQSELAEMCALSRGVLSRILGQLEAEGAVQLGYGSMTFLAHPVWRTDR